LSTATSSWKKLTKTGEVCDGKHTIGINMNAGKATTTSVGECIREGSRKSFIPGKSDHGQKKGDFCFVQFKDDCNCIDTTRLIHIADDATEIACETEGVKEGTHSSYHFELEDPEVSGVEYLGLWL
jgi:hypothetical protein